MRDAKWRRCPQIAGVADAADAGLRVRRRKSLTAADVDWNGKVGDRGPSRRRGDALTNTFRHWATPSRLMAVARSIGTSKAPLLRVFAREASL